MADKYHINPETGRANQCNAKVRCRFGADTKHYDSKEAARNGYEKTMKNETVSKPLKKTSAKNVTPAKTPKERPIVPGVPAVMSAYEIKKETQELVHEVNEWGPEMFNFSVKGLLEERGITLKEITAAERSGEYSVMAKVPSYYEVNVSTDVARAELGLPPRESTGIDDTPLRKAQIDYDNAYAATFGSFSSEEYTRVKENEAKAKAAYEAIAYPDRKPEPPSTRRLRGNGLYW